MEVVKVPPIQGRTKDFYLYPIGDIHAGSIHCAENKIRDKVREIQSNPDAVWLGMGDYADCILKDDKRFDMEGLAPWVEKGNITESQRVWLKELFTPIKDKCLGLLTGNHEESIHLSYQMDFTRNLASDLGATYAGYSAFLPLHFALSSTQRYHVLVHAWHGAGAAQTEGARLNRLMRLVNDVQADIYLMGHLHAMTAHTPDRLVYKNGRIQSLKLAATITGSWLKAYDQGTPTSYAERQGYKPSRIGCPIVHIQPSRQAFGLIS